MRQVGSNKEVEAIVGKLDDNVICVADNEICIASGDFCQFYDCKSHVTATAISGDTVFVGTLSALLYYPR